MSITNPKALNIFNGKLKVDTGPTLIPPGINRVKVSEIKAGSKLTFFIVFNQRVDDLAIGDIDVTAPAQLISWLGTGRVRQNRLHTPPTWILEYDVSSIFDASALPDDYTLSISIRANSITGDGMPDRY